MTTNNTILQLGDIEALQAALDRDRGFKGKRAKKPQKRIRRSGKKNKRKKEKDLTPDRTTKSLFEELLMQGIIKLHPEVSLDEFKGEKSFVNYDLRMKEKDPLPTLGTFEYVTFKFTLLNLRSLCMTLYIHGSVQNTYFNLFVLSIDTISTTTNKSYSRCVFSLGKNYFLNLRRI